MHLCAKHLWAVPATSLATNRIVGKCRRERRGGHFISIIDRSVTKSQPRLKVAPARNNRPTYNFLR
jgi:hypothetical protein